MIDIKRDMIAAKFTNYFPSLANTHFRFYWFGQIVLNIGLSMQEVAQLWLIYSITKSAFLLSLVGILQYAPMLFLSLFAGALIDKFCTGKLLKITHFMFMAISFTMGVLVFLGVMEYWFIFIGAIVQGFSSTMDIPGKQAYVNDIVPRDILTNAVAINTSAYHISRIVGPVLGGIIMSGAGIGYCYLLAGLCCFPMLLMLFKHKADAVKAEVNINLRSFWQDIKKGVSYALNTKDMFKTILGASIMSVLLNNFSVFLPVLANTMNQKEIGYGMMVTILGAGASTGAFVVAAKSRKGSKDATMYLCSFVVAGMMIFLGLNKNYTAALVILVVSGMFLTSFYANANSKVLLLCDNEYKGRVMGLYSLMNVGLSPLGNLYAGSMTNILGIQLCLVSTGLLTALVMGALVLWKKKTVHVNKPVELQ